MSSSALTYYFISLIISLEGVSSSAPSLIFFYFSISQAGCLIGVDSSASSHCFLITVSNIILSVKSDAHTNDCIFPVVRIPRVKSPQWSISAPYFSLSLKELVFTINFWLSHSSVQVSSSAPCFLPSYTVYLRNHWNIYCNLQASSSAPSIHILIFKDNRLQTASIILPLLLLLLINIRVSSSAPCNISVKTAFNSNRPTHQSTVTNVSLDVLLEDSSVPIWSDHRHLCLFTLTLLPPYASFTDVLQVVFPVDSSVPKLIGYCRYGLSVVNLPPISCIYRLLLSLYLCP